MIPFRAPEPALDDSQPVAARRLARIPFRALVENLRSLYDRATPDELRAGLDWYRTAHSIAREIGAELGATVETGAAILAALSPRCDWSDNVEDARRVARGESTVRATRANADKARAIANGAPISSTLVKARGGFKVRAFYACILDPESPAAPVCIDSHGIGAAIGRTPTDAEANVAFSRRPFYARLARAFDAARPENLPAREFQAIVWVVWRAIPRANRIPF